MGRQMIVPMPQVTVIPPTLQCHMCFDLVDMGIIDPEEVRPALVVTPRGGSLCDWHRNKASLAGAIYNEHREEMRARLSEEGFLVESRVYQDVPPGVLYEASDPAHDAREQVIEHIVTTAHDLAGTVEQVRAGLIEMAEKDYGNCKHPLGGEDSPDRCVRCLARRFLALLDSSSGWRWQQNNLGLPR